MDILLFGGRSNNLLAEAIADTLGITPGRLKIKRFPDGELDVSVEEDVSGSDVYFLKSTGPPVADNLLELLFCIDAISRAGAAGICAVIPYFGYARQDRRVSGRDPVGARVIADLLGTSSISRIAIVDIHNPSIEGFFSVPVANITAVPLLADSASPEEAGIVVAPDLGAVKLAESYGKHLGLPVAIVHKTRLSGEDVRAHSVTGDVRNKKPLIVDDIISTAGTIAAAANAVLEAGCLPEIAVAATHALLAGPAIGRLKSFPLTNLYVSNSLYHAPEKDLYMDEVNLAPLLAEVIERLHERRPLTGLSGHR